MNTALTTFPLSNEAFILSNKKHFHVSVELSHIHSLPPEVAKHHTLDSIVFQPCHVFDPLPVPVLWSFAACLNLLPVIRELLFLLLWKLLDRPLPVWPLCLLMKLHLDPTLPSPPLCYRILRIQRLILGKELYLLGTVFTGSVSCPIKYHFMMTFCLYVGSN